MSAIILPFEHPNLRRRIEREVAAKHAANVQHMSATLDLLMAGNLAARILAPLQKLWQ